MSGRCSLTPAIEEWCTPEQNAILWSALCKRAGWGRRTEVSLVLDVADPAALVALGEALGTLAADLWLDGEIDLG